jgi:hypothetical protein
MTDRKAAAVTLNLLAEAINLAGANGLCAAPLP